MNKNDFLVVAYDTNDIHAKQNRGGDNTVFDFANFDKHRTELVGYTTNAVNYFEKAFNKYPNTSGVVKIYLREQAFAKSHRPTEIIKDADCKIVGTGTLGELFVSVNSSSISKLETKIKNSQKQKNIANISAIKEIAPYTPDDIISKDIRELKNYNQVLKVKLFDHNNDVLNYNNELKFVEILNKLGLQNDVDFKKLKYTKKLNIYSVNFKTKEIFEEASDFIGLKSISNFMNFCPIKQHSVKAASNNLALNEPNEKLPIVGLVDSGISPTNEILKPWIVGKSNYIAKPALQDYSHGTFIAGLITNARNLNNDDIFPNVQARIFDIPVLDDSLREDELLAILEIELEKHPEIKIWNLSLGTDAICDNYSFSDFGMALDELQERFNVIFVIAAGNYCESPLRQWPSNISNNTDRITTPADSVRAITVGSLAHKQIISSVVSPNEPSPFSRRGPGPMFIPKPEVVHYGGNCDKKLDCKQTGLVSFDEAGNLTESVGTSFSTPIVSTILANLVNNIDGEFNPNLAKALLIHSAVLKQKELSESDINYFGFGVPGDLNEMLLSPDWQATSIFNVKLQPGLIYQKDFPIPECLITSDGKVFGDIYVTLVYNQPLDENNASEYCRTNVDVSLGSIDTVGKYTKQVPLDTPDCAGNFEKILIEHGYKWSPVKVYKRSIPKGVNAINWRLNVGVLTRSQFELDEPQDATIIVTISDPSKILPVYNDFVVASRTKGWVTNALRVNNRLRPQQ